MSKTRANKELVNQAQKEKLIQQLAKNEWIQGKVIYLDFEGGFYGIITDDGRKLLPMRLDEKYLKHNTVIKLKGKAVTDLNTIQQWGQPFSITDIKLIKKGSGIRATEM